MNNIIITILFFSFFLSCKNQSNNNKPIARVLEHKLYKNQIPQFDSRFSEDSILFVNNFIDKWAMQKLLIYIHIKTSLNVCYHQKNQKDLFLVQMNVQKYKDKVSKYLI